MQTNATRRRRAVAICDTTEAWRACGRTLDRAVKVLVAPQTDQIHV